jgi:transposase-like protein
MDIYEIGQRFTTEASVYDLLEQTRWVRKRVCPKCKVEHTNKRYDNFQYYCSKCKYRFSVLTGTYLHGTRIPLQKWLLAFAVVSDAKKGISAHQLKRNIGVTYLTAFRMAHKIRDIMAEEKVDVLTDVVEMDETYIGGKPRKPNVKALLTDKGKKYLIDRTQEVAQMGFDLRALKGNTAQVDLNTKRGRGSQKLVSVTGIVQRDGAVVAEVMSSLGAKKLQDLVKKHVQTDSALLITDTYKGYDRMKNIIEHIKIDHSKLYSYNGVNTNTIESFWAIVERGIMGTYHHVTMKYLPKYVVEFCFKYNNRNYDDMFETLVKAAMNVQIGAPIIHDPKKPRAKRRVKQGNLGSKKPIDKVKTPF